MNKKNCNLTIPDTLLGLPLLSLAIGRSYCQVIENNLNFIVTTDCGTVSNTYGIKLVDKYHNIFIDTDNGNNWDDVEKMAKAMLNDYVKDRLVELAKISAVLNNNKKE